MNIEDYKQYHQKGGTYIIPVEVFNELFNEVEENQGMIIIMEKYLELIHDLAFDYDGCNTIEGLKKLIDELDRYARLGRCCNTNSPIYVNGDKYYNILNEELEKGENNEK